MKTHSTGIAIFATILSILVPFFAAAQSYDPVHGGELLDQLRSPRFLGGTENSASTESVGGDVVNPATSALKQRVHLDTSYVSIVGDGALNGHAANLGASIPTRVGVFTGSANVAQANYDAMNLGNRGSVNFSFAKDLYPSLLFGTGVRTHFGSNGGSTGFGAGLDLGIIHNLGPVGPLPQLRWGFALTQLGLGYAPETDRTASPAPFTPVADVEALLVSTEDVQWSVHTGFSAPSFQNVRYRAGSRVSFFDRITVDLGWDVDLVEQTTSSRDTGSMLPSVGLSVRFQTNLQGEDGVISDQGWNRSDIDIRGAWAPLYENVWAAGGGVQVALGVIDTVPPEVTVTYPETVYLSPNNDGSADDLLLPVEIADERFVTSWALTITDEAGQTVRTIENKEQRPENEGFRNIVDRLLYVKKGVPIPDEVRWSGRTDDGGTAPDGAYRFTVTAVDDNGNVTVTEERPIVLDNTPPAATIDEPEEADALIFSPNADGFKDELTLPVETSEEDLWTIEVLNVDDEVVYSETTENGSVPSVTWDGRDAEGILVPDGVYSVFIAATDRAQNRTTTRLNNIIVDTQPTPIGLSIDISHFSPNGDGRRDVVILSPDVSVRDGLRSYEVVIRDRAETAVRRFSGDEAIPDEWIFDGNGNDGNALDEGRYRADLTVLYRNGNRPRAMSPEIVLDTTAPRLSTRADTPVFSPNGDGNLDTVRFLQTTDTAPDWRATITPTARDGDATAPVRTFSWTGAPEEELVWDGRDGDGNTVPDGEYTYVLTGTDRAGNVATGSPVAVELDTRETPVYVFPSRDDSTVTGDDSSTRGGIEAFSPNGDGRQDTIFLISELADPRGAERFDLEILDENENMVARVSDTGAPQRSYPWNGRDRTGQVAPNGTYRVRLSVTYRHGNRPETVSTPFILDTRAPEASVSVDDDERVFSPDGDNDKDTILIDQSSSDESRWTAQVVRERDNTPVRTWEFSRRLQPLTWDGTDDDGEVVPDDTYRYEVIGVDEAGNRTTARTAAFTTDTREIDVRLRISRDAFSPNGDGRLDDVRFTPEANVDLTVSSWTLDVFPADGDPEDVVFTRDGSGELEEVVWDGRGTNGTVLPDGAYRGVITAQPVQREEPARAISARTVRLDTTPPTARISLSSGIISPNGDGNLDELRITQETSTEERWVATVANDAGREVGRWEWVGEAPEQLVFSGLNTARERVSDGMYTYQLTATDRAGNTGASTPAEFEIYSVDTPLRFYAQQRAFSPNGDGTLDELELASDITVPTDIVEWEFSVETAPRDGEHVAVGSGDDAAGRLRQIYRESGSRNSLPASFSWDGSTDAREQAPEGNYRATLQLTYRHGNVVRATTEPVALDVTPPEITVATDFDRFSPDGDRNRDSVRISQSSGVAEGWSARITNSDGQTVRAFSWNSEVASLEWDGTDRAGNVLPDGNYRYAVSGTDVAGNTATADSGEITIDTRPTRLYITVNPRRFSPDGDGNLDSVDIRLITSRTDGAEEWTAEVVNAQGRVVRTFSGNTVSARETITWDGADGRGRVVDGDYTVRFRVSYNNGAIPRTETPRVSVDTTGPDLAVDLEGLPFSPDNDGLNDELGLSLTADDAGPIASWSFDILDRRDRPFYRFEGTGTPRSSLIWDGRSTDGDTVISAEDYPYRFIATDAVGNTSEVRGEIPIDILVIRDGDLLKIQISNINFEPNSPLLELDATSPEGRKNSAVLTRLVEVFDKYQSYEIRVEGHAVNVTQTEREEREELQPLSLARAQTVREALIQRGMDEDRISTVGRGGTDPIVPHTDLDDRWKNRRVEFILIR